MVSALITDVYIKDPAIFCLQCRKIGWTKADIIQINYSMGDPACIPFKGQVGGEAWANLQPWLNHWITSLLFLSHFYLLELHELCMLLQSLFLILKKKRSLGTILAQQMLTSRWNFSGVHLSAQSRNKHCLIAKTYRWHQQNAANSSIVFMQRYIYAAF